MNHNTSQIDIEENPFRKELQNDLRKKEQQRSVSPIPILSPKTEALANEQSEHSDFSHTKEKKAKHKKKEQTTEQFKDKVFISSQQWTQQSQDTKKEKNIELELKKRQYNAKEIIKNKGHEINFEKKRPELKEMLRHNIQESRSQNTFVAQYAKFKVGIVNQMLTFLDTPLEEIDSIKKEALDEIITDNKTEMAENIYHLELIDILHGKTKKAKKQAIIYKQLQTELFLQINGILEPGYWSKEKLLEEKIKQCKKICEEFANEKQHLEYLLDVIDQQNLSGESNEKIIK